MESSVRREPSPVSTLSSPERAAAGRGATVRIGDGSVAVRLADGARGGNDRRLSGRTDRTSRSHKANAIEAASDQTIRVILIFFGF